jgi:hypothetical protein
MGKVISSQEAHMLANMSIVPETGFEFCDMGILLHDGYKGSPGNYTCYCLNLTENEKKKNDVVSIKLEYGGGKLPCQARKLGDFNVKTETSNSHIGGKVRYLTDHICGKCSYGRKQAFENHVPEQDDESARKKPCAKAGTEANVAYAVRNMSEINEDLSRQFLES